ncbi:MAG: DUF3305 domain-containing protein [Usitatibacter sp.]
MLNRPTQKASVILEREEVESRWETHRWQVVGAIPDVGGEPRTIPVRNGVIHRMFSGLDLTLFADEAEGYFLNVSSEGPSVFVSVRIDEATGEPYPFQATLSYNEAARWMDGGESVERADAWPELTQWMGEWVEENYRPEPKRRQRPKSFEGKEGQLREKGKS